MNRIRNYLVIAILLAFVMACDNGSTDPTPVVVPSVITINGVEFPISGATAADVEKIKGIIEGLTAYEMNLLLDSIDSIVVGEANGYNNRILTLDKAGTVENLTAFLQSVAKDIDLDNTPTFVELDGADIPVATDVNAAQTTTTLGFVISGFNGLDAAAKSLLDSQISKVKIVSGDGASMAKVGGKYEFTFGIDATVADIKAKFKAAADQIEYDNTPTPDKVTLGTNVDIPVDANGFDAFQTIDTLKIVTEAFEDLTTDAKTLLAGKIVKVKIGNTTTFVKVGANYELTFASDVNVANGKANFQGAANEIDAANELANMPTSVNLGSAVTLEVENGIRSAQANAAKAVIETAYGTLAAGVKTDLSGDIGKVKIINGATGWAIETGKYTLSFKIDVNAAGAKTNFENAEKDLGKCVCPANEVVLVGEGCSAKYHDTGIEVAGQRVNGIAVTNGENVANFNTMTERVADAISWLTSTQIAYIEANIQEIKIIAGPAAVTPPLNGILTIGNDKLDSDIWGVFDDWLVANSIVMLQKTDDVKPAGGKIPTTDEWATRSVRHHFFLAPNADLT